MNPHPFSLRQLQYAVAIAECRSFRKAAERCHVSQPSLSAQLAQLEESLGVRLFERDRRHVLPTPAGEALVARARVLLADADDLLGSAKQLGDPLAGRLRIGVIPTVSPYLLPELAPVLRKRFPQLGVLWHEDKTAGLLEQLRAGQLDAALVARVPGMDDLDAQVLGQDPFVFAAAPGHALLEGKRPLQLRDIEGEQVLLLDEGHCLRDQALALCTRAHASEADFRATSLSTLAQVVAGGAAVTLLPELAVKVENRRGQLGIRPFGAPGPARTLVLTWRKRSPLAGGLERLAAAMGEVLRKPAKG